MKASGEGAGTKAGLGVEESRADKTQKAPQREKFDYLTCFNSIPSRPAGERKVRGILVRASERVLLAYEVQGSEKLIYFDFFRRVLH